MPVHSKPKPTVNRVHLPVRIAKYFQEAEKSIDTKGGSEQQTAHCQLEHAKTKFKKLLHYKKESKCSAQIAAGGLPQSHELYPQNITVFEATLKVNKRKYMHINPTMDVLKQKRHFATWFRRWR
ncbi:hypothetical protein IE81DRAFT_349491 [Ceraceosorus guamensis]|uniref:Uncharacterized protein n=1 Tax=Ceraceosorus guamensis TaxID=1522189 RepID=A0A316VRD3_9BASI|nr:hypothetical protein IE81DRAFT_349491 [Ceraceosorus guamensis]PWN40167.1 hypothetical protein IE81DRAFT_349491 [Ceraceosorus guamensis]